MSSDPKAGKRIPSLDGFRALAILLVFAGHAQSYGMPLSEYADYFAKRTFIIPARDGVTLFFFLSGYIITTLMRKEYERDGTISFKRFYLRRVYRIFPPLYITLAVAALLTWAGLLKDHYTWSGITAQILHFTNYYALLFTGRNFFEGTSLLWSLAVEEHFYLFFPLLYLCLVRRLSNQQLALALFGICIAILCWRCTLYFVLDPPRNWPFIATDARIDSILFGCILAVWRNPARGKPLVENDLAEKLLLLAGFAFLVFGHFARIDALNRTLIFTMQGLAFIPIFSCAILHPDWLIFRWLNTRLIIALGAISYTFYLVHAMSLKISMRLIESTPIAITAAFVITVLFSTVMYRYIESPLARKRAALHKSTGKTFPGKAESTVKTG